MRRLEHPNIIRLKDVFLKPSPTGKYVFRGGRLVATSFDCYMAMEFCDQGDLFNMRGQLPEHEVRSLLWQLLSALRYLHGLNVWHRDIKTGNLLLTLAEGRRVLKVADFGSARSAKEGGDVHCASQDLGPMALAGSPPPGPDAGDTLARTRSDDVLMDLDPHPAEGEEGQEAGLDPGRGQQQEGSAPESARLLRGAAAAAPWMHRRHTTPAAAAAAARRNEALQAFNGANGSGGGVRPPRRDSSGGAGAGLVAVPAPDGGFLPPLTSLVCTPCYRAPEVVMSRGGYSSAIDMWSAGCVFGELLQRAAYVGKASTPHLQVAPVFAITGKPLTPTAGEHYGAAGQDGGASASTYVELSALFAVIGTPAWACIEGVRSEAWRRYLFHIPGRAPTLHRRFGQAGEVAVDLLARLLQFDPGRRANAEEAMAHEYFAMMHMEAQMEAAELSPHAEAGPKLWPTSGLTAAAAARRGSRLPGSSFRRSVSPPDGEEEAPAKRTVSFHLQEGPGAPAGTTAAATWIPAWPPTRSSAQPPLPPQPPQPQHRSAAGQQPSGPSDMDVSEVNRASEETRSAPGVVTTTGTEATGALQCFPKRSVSGGGGGSSSNGSLLTKRKQLEEDSEGDLPARMSQLQSGDAGPSVSGSAPERAAGSAGRGSSAVTAPETLSFWQLDEPSLALAALEAELASLVPLVPEGPEAHRSAAALEALHGTLGGPAAGARSATAAQTPEALAKVEEVKERLRLMLERECEEHAARAASRRGAAVRGEERGPQSSGGESGAGSLRRNNSEGYLGGGEGLAGLGGPAGLHGHLRPDPGQELDPSLIGYERIPYHADAAAARLEPEKHLWAGRHGEWTESSLAAQRRGEQSTGTWGVTLLPPGMVEGTAAGNAFRDVMRSQHAR